MSRFSTRGRLTLGAALGVAAQLSSLGLLLTSGWLVVRASEQPPVLYLLVAVTSVRMFGVARAALRYAERLLTHDAALSRSVDERVRAVEALARGGTARLLGHGARRGAVVRSVVDDVETVQDGLLRLRLPWLNAVVTVAVASLALVLILPAAGLVVLAYGVAALLLVRLVVPRLVPPEADDHARADVAAGVTELVRAAPDLVAFGSTRGRLQQAQADVDVIARADRRRAWAGGLGSLLVLTTCAAAVVALVAVVADAGLAGPLAGLVLLTPVGLVDVLDAVAEAERLRPGVRSARRRLADLAALEDPLPTGQPGVAPDGFGLALRDVAIGWDDDLVRGLDVEIPEGSRVVVTGPSGSGKSTLAATLQRHVAARDGQVLLGGHDLLDLTPETVRAAVGWMGQDAVVFDTTVRENLRLAAPDADDARLWTVLARVRLADVVATWPDGLDTELGEDGARISGGERQRLALARMLLAGHRVLVLDEPTEHLDAPTAHALLDDVDALAPAHTVIVISHAPDVVARFERRIRLTTVDQRSGDPVERTGQSVLLSASTRSV